MNREIKFRCWDTVGKFYHPGFTIQEIVQIMRTTEPPGIKAEDELKHLERLLALAQNVLKCVPLEDFGAGMNVYLTGFDEAVKKYQTALKSEGTQSKE